MQGRRYIIYIILKKNYISILSCTLYVRNPFANLQFHLFFYHFGGTKVVYIEIDHQLYIHYTGICIVYLYIYYMQAAIMTMRECSLAAYCVHNSLYSTVCSLFVAFWQ